MIKPKELDKLVFDYIYPWGEVLSLVALVIQASYHLTLQATQAQIVFGRDMLFNMKKMINWQLMTKNKHKQIARDNKWENTECIPHQYKIGDKVLRIIGVFEESTPNIKVILIRLLRYIQMVQLPLHKAWNTGLYLLEI